MKYFPASLSRFHKLKVLKLSNISANRIPFRIFLLPNLQELDLSKNCLLALPGTITKRLKKFDKLDISENEFSQSDLATSIDMNKMPKDYVPTLLEFSMRNTLKNK